MKKLLLVGFILAIALGADAQKKPKINKAKVLWEQGQLMEAKEIIDAAIDHEKTKEDGKTWYYRGLIYASLDTSSTLDVAGAFETAMEAFKKADELGGGKGYTMGINPATGLPVTELEQKGGFRQYYFDQGIAKYEAQNSKEASYLFEKSSRLTENDTLGISYAGYMAADGGESERALKLMNEALSRGATSQDLFINIYNIHMEAENFDEALKILSKAQETHPSNSNFGKMEIDILIKTGKAEEAKQRLKEEIKAEPDNHLLLFNLALLQEEDEGPEAALETYKKVVAAKPDFYSGHYNMGILMYQKGADIQKEINFLGTSSADRKKANELAPARDEAFKAALPVWEKIVSLKPDNGNAVDVLINIHEVLGNKEEAKKWKEKREKLD